MPSPVLLNGYSPLLLFLRFTILSVSSQLLEDTNGGLVILSSGLSLSKLISSLLLLHSTSQGTLLILSPSSATLKSKINFHLKTLNPQFYQVPVEITADLPVNHRHSLYSSGSVCFITPRILIVDLLTNKLPASIISGLIILNAHSVSETSTEAFIVRIFRSLNRSAFVRVFSDRPQAMVSGFAKAERTMKCLHIRGDCNSSEKLLQMFQPPKNAVCRDFEERPVTNLLRLW
ncbi:DNA repair endonuclease uvh1 [Lathyrus oleraceus]|uniref:DNA repair endonuclease uvh1 n=1 Tax=Pisum sativum TaxID=3888 RepID=A0A9D4XIW0_PEA|nr:DNA repair endonuclease uvh1 [Pisum sativum]